MPRDDGNPAVAAGLPELIGCDVWFADRFGAIDAAQEGFAHIDGLELVIQDRPDEQTPEAQP